MASIVCAPNSSGGNPIFARVPPDVALMRARMSIRPAKAGFPSLIQLESDHAGILRLSSRSAHPPGHHPWATRRKGQGEQAIDMQDRSPPSCRPGNQPKGAGGAGRVRRRVYPGDRNTWPVDTGRQERRQESRVSDSRGDRGLSSPIAKGGLPHFRFDPDPWVIAVFPDKDCSGFFERLTHYLDRSRH